MKLISYFPIIVLFLLSELNVSRTQDETTENGNKNVCEVADIWKLVGLKTHLGVQGDKNYGTNFEKCKKEVQR